ncbi:MAG TPA: TlpA disulfide reductase family protein [Gammaproteobacteria bacterium]|nr:TlpA disulfide reductase family protein [Gammaproteobacteria bacterium]
MKPLHKFLIGILLLLAALAGYNLAWLLHPPQAQFQAPPPVKESPAPETLLGQQRPAFTLPDLAGTAHSVSEWDGHALLINFWATWCTPCREEIPAFIEIRRRYEKRGFEIVGIAVDSPEFVTEYARDLGIPYPLLYGSDDAVEVSRLYGNQQGTLPFTVFVDAKGRIAHIHNSGVLTESELTPIVEDLLKVSAENEPKRSKLP